MTTEPDPASAPLSDADLARLEALLADGQAITPAEARALCREVRRLRAENARLWEALEFIAGGAHSNAGSCQDCDSIAQIAAEALDGAGPEASPPAAETEG